MSDIDDKVSLWTYNKAQPPTYNVTSFAVHSATYATVFNNTCMSTNRQSDSVLQDVTVDATFMAFGR